MMGIGYVRSRRKIKTRRCGSDALHAAGRGRIFEDTASGAKERGPGLDEAPGFARKGDELVVWKLDRVGRSLPRLIKFMGQLHKRGIGFCSATENIETATPGGRKPLATAKRRVLRAMWAEGAMTTNEIETQLEIGQRTVFKYIKGESADKALRTGFQDEPAP